MKTPQDNLDDSKPKVPQKKKKPVQKQQEPNMKQYVVTNPEDVELLQKILENQIDNKEATRRYTNKSEMESDMSNLKAMVSEYLKSFLIIGYTVDGTRIAIKHVKSNESEDALIEQLRYIFFRTMGDPP